MILSGSSCIGTKHKAVTLSWYSIYGLVFRVPPISVKLRIRFQILTFRPCFPWVFWHAPRNDIDSYSLPPDLGYDMSSSILLNYIDPCPRLGVTVRILPALAHKYYLTAPHYLHFHISCYCFLCELIDGRRHFFYGLREYMEWLCRLLRR